MAASRISELTANRREYALDLVAQGNQDRDGDHGNEGENEGVLHQRLPLLAGATGSQKIQNSNSHLGSCFVQN